MGTVVAFLALRHQRSAPRLALERRALLDFEPRVETAVRGIADVLRRHDPHLTDMAACMTLRPALNDVIRSWESSVGKRIATPNVHKAYAALPLVELTLQLERLEADLSPFYRDRYNDVNLNEGPNVRYGEVLEIAERLRPGFDALLAALRGAIKST
jgi:hypothetical protein